MPTKGEAAKEAKAKIQVEKKAEEKKEELAQAKAEETGQKQEKKAVAKPEEKKAVAKPEEKKGAKELKKPEEVLEEKMLTISLREAWKSPRTKRAKAAVRVLKEQLQRHIKKDTKLDISVNKAIWRRGMTHPPRKIKLNIKVMKDSAKAYCTE